MLSLNCITSAVMTLRALANNGPFGNTIPVFVDRSGSQGETDREEIGMFLHLLQGYNPTYYFKVVPFDHELGEPLINPSAGQIKSMLGTCGRGGTEITKVTEAILQLPMGTPLAILCTDLGFPSEYLMVLRKLPVAIVTPGGVNADLAKISESVETILSLGFRPALCKPPAEDPMERLRKEMA